MLVQFLGGSREAGAGVHPGPVPRHLVHTAGGVAGHVGGADTRPHGGTAWASPASHTSHGPDVWLDVGVTVLLLAVHLAAVINTINTIILIIHKICERQHLSHEINGKADLRWRYNNVLIVCYHPF